MKILKLLVLSAMIIIGGYGNLAYSQIGKLKVKKPKVDLSKKTSTESSSKKSVDGKPEYDPESNTYKAYSRARDGISSAKSYLFGIEWGRNTEGTNDRTVKELAKAKENIEILRGTGIESKKPYFKTFEADYAKYSKEREEKWESYTQDKLYDNNIESYYKWAKMGWGIQDKSLEPSYKGYNKFRKDFETNRPAKFKDDYVQKRVVAVDDFFKVEVYKELPSLEAKIDKIIKDIHTINSRNEERYLLNAKSYQKEFENPLASIKYKKEFLLEDKTEINRIETKLNKEKAILDEYVTSGKCDVHRAKYEKEIVDAVRLGKKAMSNPKYEAMAKKGVKEGTPLRVVITSSTWYVKKNDFGYPLHKSIGIDIAVKKDGVCYIAYGEIRRTYEGGGEYGGEYFNYWGLQEKMNCDNINK
jgi:hypothetical protein